MHQMAGGNGRMKIPWQNLVGCLLLQFLTKGVGNLNAGFIKSQSLSRFVQALNARATLWINGVCVAIWSTFSTLDRELMQCPCVFDQQYGLHCWLSRRFVASSSKFPWKPGLIIFAQACSEECLEFATLLNVIETKNTKACRVELTFALPPFVKLMYIIHHAFTAIKKSHVDCSGLAVQGANFCRRGCLNFCRSCHQGLHHINYLCYDMFLWMLNPGTSWSALWIISNILFVGLRWGVTCQLLFLVFFSSVVVVVVVV